MGLLRSVLIVNLATICGGICTALYNTDLANWINKDCHYFALPMEIGIGIGESIAYSLVDQVGRKSTLIVSTVPYIVGFIMISRAIVNKRENAKSKSVVKEEEFDNDSVIFVNDYGDFDIPTTSVPEQPVFDDEQSFCTETFIAESLLGMGTGVVTTTNILYFSEIAKTSNRGLIGTSLVLTCEIGSLLTYILQLFFANDIILLVPITVPVVCAMLLCSIDESPFYLLSIGEENKGRIALKRLRGKEQNEDEFEMMKRLIQEDSLYENGVTWKYIKSNKAMLFVIYIISVVENLTAISGRLLYKLGLTYMHYDRQWDMEYRVILQLIVTIYVAAATSLVDRIGRRSLLIVSMCSVIACNVAASILLHNNEIKVLLQYSFTFTLIFTWMHRLALGTIIYVLIGEIFPPNMKVRIICCHQSLLHLNEHILRTVLTLLVKKFNVITLELLTFYVTAAFNVIALCPVLLFLPRTERKTWEEILHSIKKF